MFAPANEPHLTLTLTILIRRLALTLLLLTFWGWPLVGVADGSNTADGWQVQCFGRVQFEMPTELSWYAQSALSPALLKGPAQTSWFGVYGPDPLQPEHPRVQIRVSQATSLEKWKDARSFFQPSKGRAQQRVLQKKINDVSERMDELRSRYSDNPQSAEHLSLLRQLMDERRALEQARAAVGKLSVDIAVVELMIEEFGRSGRETSHLKVELAEMLAESEKHPTDELFEREYMMELEHPHALAISDPFGLSVTLWEAGRDYAFQFDRPGRHSLSSPKEQENLEQVVQDFISRFRARAEHEIPVEPGVCFPFGFIVDSGNVPFRFTQRWRPDALPSLEYRIDQPASTALINHGLMGLAPNPYASILRVRHLGPREVSFGYQSGMLIGSGARRRDLDTGEWEASESYHLLAETGPYRAVPSVFMEINVVGVDSDYPPLEQAEPEFMRILESFRPLPGMIR